MLEVFPHLYANHSSAHVSSKDPGKTGCPKAVDVPKIMADMIVIEEYKQDSMR